MIGSSGNVLPATGIGNIGHVIGQPNSPGAGVLSPTPRPAPPMPPQSQPPSIGNLQMQPPPQPRQGGNFGQIMSQLHPNTMNALKSIPPEALQQLHAAGLIHPQLMGHLRSGGTSGGRPY